MNQPSKLVYKQLASGKRLQFANWKITVYIWGLIIRPIPIPDPIELLLIVSSW